MLDHLYLACGVLYRLLFVWSLFFSIYFCSFIGYHKLTVSMFTSCGVTESTFALVSLISCIVCVESIFFYLSKVISIYFLSICFIYLSVFHVYLSICFSTLC